MSRQVRLRPIVLLTTLALMVSAVVTGVTWADNAPMWESPEGLTPGIPNSKVQMAAEDVRVQVAETSDGVVARVSADFDMLNPGPDTDMLVGFPGYAYSVLAQGSPYSPVTFSPMGIHNFRASSSLGQYTPATRKVTLGSFGGGDWFVWNMRYPGGKPLRVQVTYEQDLVSLKSYIGVRSGGWVPVSYVLRTGALWDGPIGRATVRISAPEGGGLVALPPANRDNDGQLTWDMSNFKPTEDVDAVFFRPASWRAIQAAESTAGPATATAGDLLQSANTVVDQIVGGRDFWPTNLLAFRASPQLGRYLAEVSAWTERATQVDPENAAAWELAGDLAQSPAVEKHGWLVCWPTGAADAYQRAIDLGSDSASAALADMLKNRDTGPFTQGLDYC